MSDYEVTMADDSVHEFSVKFNGPKDSMQLKIIVIDNTQVLMKVVFGEFELNYHQPILTNHQVLVF